MATLFTGSKFYATNANGTPLAGGRVYTYKAGTLVPLATYTDQGGLSQNTNPVILDAAGRASIWLGSGAYRFIVKDANDVTAPDGDVDNIVVDGGLSAFVSSLSASTGAGLVGEIQAGIGAVARTVQAELRESYCPMQYGAAGDGVANDATALTNCWAACPAYGVIDLRGKTYAVSTAIPRPAIGVTIRNGRIKLIDGAAQFLYALVANDYCTFDSVYFLGTGAVAPTASLTFTTSVGGASSGTLTAAITNGSYTITFSNGNVRLVTVTGGTAVSWTGALTAGTVTTATYAPAPLYRGGIFGGNTGYPSPMNTAPANYVAVRGCTFDSLTVGVWSGGAAGDAVPVGWSIDSTTKFVNIVGYPGQSEGYGVLFTPCNNSSVIGAKFKTIRRHAVYLAGEASNNVVDSNVIDGCDNIGIQSNTAVTQNYADGNVISNNTMRGFTRSIAYGYRSSVGIGLYGKIQNAVVQGNKIFGALDTGIDTSGELGGLAYSDRLVIANNQIVLDSAATDAAIRMDGLQSGKVFGNNLLLNGSVYGVIATSTVGVPTTVIDVTENTVETTNASAIAFRIAFSSARTLRVFRNTVNGFPVALANTISDTSSAGVVRTDLNGNVGAYATDANFTHNSGGTIANTDCPRVVWSGSITAARTVTLSDTSVPIGAQFYLARPATGAFNVNVNDAGAGLIKALTAGQWAVFGFNGTAWVEISFGSL